LDRWLRSLDLDLAIPVARHQNVADRPTLVFLCPLQKQRVDPSEGVAGIALDVTVDASGTAGGKI